MINLVHVSEDHTSANAGIAHAINSYARQMLSWQGPSDSVEICTVADGRPAVASPVPVTELPLSPLWAPWRYAPAMAGWLAERIRSGTVNLLHAHGCWMAPQFTAARAASRFNVPGVLTNHGALTDWALAQPGRLGAMKKRLYLALVGQPVLARLTVLHAITPEDRDCLHRLFPGHRVELIPNAIDVEEIAAACPPDRQPDQDYVLFIGRLHPKKGVHLLIEAFLAARLPPGWRLVVAGPPELPAYAEQLQAMVRQANAEDRVQLVGPVWGAARFPLMRDAKVVAAPSHSEVIGLVNLEAAACGTPSITTRATGLLDWGEGGGLLLAEPTVPALVAALEQVRDWSAGERAARGGASRELVCRRYSTTATAPQWQALYRELVAAG